MDSSSSSTSFAPGDESKDGDPLSAREQQQKSPFFQMQRKTDGGKGNKPDDFGPSSPISVVLSYWKDFDLESARGGLDEQGLKIAEHQEKSQSNRRKLAEATRDFKKADNEEKAKLFGGLLKAYQEEVDNLTKRAKFAENAFLGIYQSLYEAPDPVPVLASAAEVTARALELEAENRKMKVELDEFRAEASHLKNQHATVRRLEERNRQLEQQMEEKVKEIVAVKHQVLAEESQKSLDALREREEQLHDQLRAAKESVVTMQRLHEYGQSQLFELSAKSEEERVAKQSELNLLTDEVDRAQTRLLSLEREKELLKSQLHALQESSAHEEEVRSDSEGGGLSGGAVAALEAAVAAKERVISDLHVDLHRAETALALEKEQHVQEIKKLHAVIEQKDNEVQLLNQELGVRPTARQLENLKKQLRILQAVGYNAVEVDDWENPSEGWKSGGEMGRLEALLLEKNRKVEHELTQIKVQLSEKDKSEASAHIKVKELEAKVEEQTKLIARLEEDILKGYGSSDRKMLSLDDWDAPESSIGSILQSAVRQGRHGVTAGGGQRRPDEEENSMLTVVCGQRDRFRQRMAELEEELRQTREKWRGVLSELERWKAENVMLYEKIRYVQEYTSGSSSGTRDKAQMRSSKKREDDLEGGPLGVDVEAKYQKLYEENINPFTAFSNKEREQRFKELGLRDRITLTSGRFLLSNKHARTFVFFYSIALHVLVFLSMYKLSMQTPYGFRRGLDVRQGGGVRLVGSSATTMTTAATSTTPALEETIAMAAGMFLPNSTNFDNLPNA